jgi:hypothetical protein
MAASLATKGLFVECSATDHLQDLAHEEAGSSLLAAGGRPESTRFVEHAPVVLQALMEIHVKFVVAPYEADAQMAYLVKASFADIVITEDSDLLAYGCPEVLFKLDKTGECDHIRLADMPFNRTLSFVSFDHDNFIEVSSLLEYRSNDDCQYREVCWALPPAHRGCIAAIERDAHTRRLLFGGVGAPP